MGLAFVLGQAAGVTADTTRTTLDVWPGKPPCEVGTVGEEQVKKEIQPDGTTVIVSVRNVSKPTLTVCLPEALHAARV